MKILQFKYANIKNIRPLPSRQIFENMEKKLTFQTDINGLRAISVLLVMMYHFNIDIFKGGFIGVDVFFVISGYLMTKIILLAIEKGKFNYIGFLYRRAIRIFPALFFVVFVLLLLGAFILPPPDLDSLAKQAIRSLTFNSNNYYASQQGYFSSGIDDRWLLHTWSLSVEWQFYMIYPVIMLIGGMLAQYAGKVSRDIFLAVFLGIVGLLSFVFCMHADSQFSFFSVLARAWQMIFGGLVFLASRKISFNSRLSAGLSYAGVFLILLSAMIVRYFSMEKSWPGYFSVVPVISACMVLISGYQENRLLDHRVLQKVGLASYSIYLWHWPIVVAMTITGIIDTDPKIAKIFGISLSLLFGFLSYYYIEPVKNLKLLSLRAGLIRLLAAGAVLAGVAGVIGFSDGMLFRVNDTRQLQAMIAAEHSDSYKKECENLGATKDNFCLLNSKLAGKKILVIGDSHAGHLYSWFEHNSQVNTTFFVKSGCPVIFGFDRISQMNSDCSGFSKKAFELAASGTYSTVIISENWTGFSDSSDDICRNIDGRCDAPSKSPDAIKPVEQTRRSINYLMAAGIDVVVVDATPNFQFNVPRRLWRNIFWYGKSDFSFVSNDFYEKNKLYDQLFKEMEKNPKFHLVSLRQKICKQGRCSIYDVNQGVAIFKDHDHFNPVWIASNGKEFLPFTSK